MQVHFSCHSDYEDLVPLLIDGFWEEGTVVSYLPATEEEPMALWKIRLDTDASVAKKDTRNCEKKAARFQDLEEHELRDAIRRFTYLTYSTMSYFR